MFQMILYTQWKWSRLLLLPCVLIAFAVPIVSLSVVSGAGEIWNIAAFVDRLGGYAVVYPVLAAALGLIVAATAWREDHRGKHVYALALPIPRWHYALLRFAGGAVVLAVPIVALWIGALLATGLTAIPEGLRAYPNALALRFALAAYVAYAAFFAVSAGTERTAAYALGAVGGVLVLQLLLEVAGLQVNLVLALFGGIAGPGGPLAVFTGPWMLIDV